MANTVEERALKGAAVRIRVAAGGNSPAHAAGGVACSV